MSHDDDKSFDLAVAVLIPILGFFVEGGGAKFREGHRSLIRCRFCSLMVNILYILDLEPEKAPAPSDGGLCAVLYRWTLAPAGD